MHESMASVSDAEALAKRVTGFFSDSAEEGLIKETSFKKIFKADFFERSALVKVYKNTTVARQLKSLFRSSGAFSEFFAANQILKNGISTPLPLLVGQRKKMGLVSESVIITEFLEGACDLRDCLLHNTFSAFSEKRDFFYAFGRLTQKVFSNRIYQEDYSVNNFMMRKEQGINRLFLIDLEKVRVDTEIPKEKALWLLGKLNRLGRVVSLTDRIRFLKGYLGDAGKDRNQLKALAIRIQTETLAVLKRDFKHGRKTSPYTCNDYRPFRKGTVRGLFLNAYDQADIENLAEDIKARSQTFSVSLKAKGGERVLTVLKLEGDKQADRAWSLVSNLVIAGLAAKLPDLLLQGKDVGGIAFETAAYEQLKQAILLEKEKSGFLTDNFKTELEMLAGLLKEVC